MFEIIPNWHPIVVHFTIGLLGTSVFFFILSKLFSSVSLQKQWLTVANWNLWLGAFFSIITAVAGWFAYNTVLHDTPSHAAMTTHRNWALVTLVIFLLLALWSYVNYRKKIKPGIVFIIIALAGSGLLASTGWLGGEAVYRYGLGVMSLPKVESDGHNHVHDENNDKSVSLPGDAPLRNVHDDNHRH